MWKRIKTKVKRVTERVRKRKEVTKIKIKAIAGNIDFKDSEDYPEEYRNKRWRHNLTDQSITVKGKITKKKIDQSLLTLMQNVHQKHYPNREKIKSDKIWCKMSVEDEDINYQAY